MNIFPSKIKTFGIFQAIAAAMPLLVPPIEIRTLETQNKVDFILENSVNFNEEEDFTEVRPD